ncbi:Ornithine cyclodeaminase [Xylanimonas cellulosilytica DSM 15894]|uniref:Ornithine cyclodeaminase n=1 Tax=Xylanimonas cellulosilytica (strain DSM 15894 / JCM 12276 / CECT 5975 / KCTC 9989 / LMG 20990 / NBRC 107835 / XIL07) TaxID=446471 RepID=D1BRN7_XYLCX|nr:ornithine cyclodeaminase [Xylanimonas cellulosilytica]ACZ32303.1 Ornithine cyclodeaminase [Xylanimonas cellulosilytica DSM 15894]
MTRVPYLDVPATAAWVARRGAEAVIADLTDALERDFERWPELETRPRLASHSRDGVIELMPAADATTFGFKLVNGHPRNPSRGYQTVTALGMLVDVHNGYPSFLAEMTILTALRTAATSALAARYLAPRGARTLALVGAGAQAEFQALGMRAELDIDHLRVYDVDPAATAKLVRNATALGFDVVVCDDAGQAARSADVVTTCTADKRNATVLHDVDVQAGQHLNAIGGDCPGKTELEPATLRRASVFVEHEAQTRIEGEIQRQPSDFPVTELWQVVAGRVPGRRDDDEITVFDSVGFAVEDLTTLQFVRDDLLDTGVPDPLVQWLDLIADPEDPKDLYSLVTTADRTAVPTPR